MARPLKHISKASSTGINWRGGLVTLDIWCKIVFTISMRVSIFGLCRGRKPHYPVIRLSYKTVRSIDNLDNSKYLSAKIFADLQGWRESS